MIDKTLPPSRAQGDENMKRTAAALSAMLLVVACGITHAQVPPFEVKGVPLGATMAALKAALPQFECDGSTCTLDIRPDRAFDCIRRGQDATDCWKRYGEPVKFGDVTPKYFLALFRDDALGKVIIKINETDVRGTVRALTEKYGAPTKDGVEQVKNRMGAAFENRVVMWLRRDGRLVVEQRTGKLDEGSVVFSSKSYDDADLAEQAAKAKAAAKGL